MVLFCFLIKKRCGVEDIELITPKGNHSKSNRKTNYDTNLKKKLI